MQLRRKAIERDAAETPTSVVALPLRPWHEWSTARFQIACRKRKDGQSGKQQCCAVIAIGQQVPQRPEADPNCHGVFQLLRHEPRNRKMPMKMKAEQVSTRSWHGGPSPVAHRAVGDPLPEGPEHRANNTRIRCHKRHHRLCRRFAPHAPSMVAWPGSGAGCRKKQQGCEKRHSAHHRNAEHIRVEAKQEDQHRAQCR